MHKHCREETKKKKCKEIKIVKNTDIVTLVKTMQRFIKPDSGTRCHSLQLIDPPLFLFPRPPIDHPKQRQLYFPFWIFWTGSI